MADIDSTPLPPFPETPEEAIAYLAVLRERTDVLSEQLRFAKDCDYNASDILHKKADLGRKRCVVRQLFRASLGDDL